MPERAAREVDHRGQIAVMPAHFDHACATYLLSLLDYSAASRLCSMEHFEPLVMSHPREGRMAVGFVSALDYHQADVGPYREWILGIWVTPRGLPAPELNWVNPTSLFFCGVRAENEGFGFYAPKMILTETLPTDIGIEHYGIPKEIGEVRYERDAARTEIRVGTANGEPIMSASVPNARGVFKRCGAMWSVIRAFGLGATMRFGRKSELPVRLVGSARHCAKEGLAVARVDPQTKFFFWDDRDCQLTINRESEWGGVLADLRFAPALVCHIPNLAFVLSGPMDQFAAANEAATAGAGSRGPGA